MTSSILRTVTALMVMLTSSIAHCEPLFDGRTISADLRDKGLLRLNGATDSLWASLSGTPATAATPLEWLVAYSTHCGSEDTAMQVMAPIAGSGVAERVIEREALPPGSVTDAYTVTTDRSAKDPTASFVISVVVRQDEPVQVAHVPLTNIRRLTREDIVPLADILAEAQQPLDIQFSYKSPKTQTQVAALEITLREHLDWTRYGYTEVYDGGAVGEPLEVRVTPWRGASKVFS